jgi:hypothetical protein
MAVQGNDGPGGEPGEVESLSADAAAQVKHDRRRRQIPTKRKSLCGVGSLIGEPARNAL